MALDTPFAPRAVVAIDFGTSRSGYAFAFLTEPDEIYSQQTWPGGQTHHLKTLTNVLIRNEETLECAFGFDARDEYLEMDEEEQANALFFEKFKMCLYEPGASVPRARSANGKTMPAVIVFAAALKFMKEHALKKINGSKSSKYENTDLLWVLTVPAIWDNKAKQIMRKAAERAGLAEHPKQLRLALEPEGASLVCRKERVKADGDMLPKGTAYMVVDCGGGTVDITCHGIIDEMKVRELCPASGGNWGSTYIDDNYYQFLCELFGQDAIDSFRNGKPAEWVDTMDKFESSKIRATGAEDKRGISLNFAFVKYMEAKFEGGGIKKVCKDYTKKQERDDYWVKYRDGVIMISISILLDKLFNPILEKIINHVEELLALPKVKNTKHIFVVGGFAESQILQNALYDLGKRRSICVTIPLRPGLGVVMGAVMFGLAPERITSRSSKYTYGCGTTTSEVSGHPPHRIEKDKKGVPRVYRIFDKFVTVGDEIDTETVVKSRFYPLYEDQTSVSFKLYTSTQPDPHYTDEQHVKQIGMISVDIPDTTGGKDRPIDVSMKFGGTEVEVTALAVNTGERAHTTIDFECDR